MSLLPSILSLYSIRKNLSSALAGAGLGGDAEHGFLLIEALIALTIAITFSLVFAYFQWTCVRHEQDANDYLQAVSLASACIEHVHAYGQLPQGSSYTEGKFTISWQGRSISARLIDTDWMIRDKLKVHNTWFEVTVSWLSTYKRQTAITIPVGVLINNEAHT